MGGMGSGRYGAGYEQGKPCANRFRWLDLKEFKDVLKQDQPARFILGDTIKGKVDPNKHTIHLNGIGTLHLETSPCHYGGVRYYFSCPECAGTCRKLALGMEGLKCRKCYDMNYYSQQHTKTDPYYYMWQMEAICKRIDPSYSQDSGIDMLFPSKPKYMKFRAYDRYYKQFRYYQDKANQVWLEGCRTRLG